MISIIPLNIDIIIKSFEVMPEHKFSLPKLDLSPQITVQVDETMLNYKCESHGGSSNIN